MKDAIYGGVNAAVLTAMKPDLTPDLDRMAAHAKWLLANGCTGLGVLGTTGEANSFGLHERKAILEGLIARGIPAARMMPGTGCASLMDSVELTKHARDAGCPGVLMLPPFYYKGVTEDGLFAAYAEVVERLADRRLRIVLYHIPQMSAVPIPFAVIARLRAAFPGTFTGIKDSAGDLAHMEALVEAFPSLAVLAGADPLMLPLLRKGGAGCITATSNIVAADLAFVFRHFADPDRASEVEAAQARIVAMRNRASRFAQMASLKALLADRTAELGWHRLRPPLLPLSPAERSALLDD